MMPILIYDPPRLVAPSPAPSATTAGTKTPSPAPPATPASLAALLQSPADLAKLALIRRKLVKEKAAIDARLNEGVSRQLADTRRGLGALIGAREAVGRVREEVAGLQVLRGTRIAVDATGETEDEALRKIAQVAKIARNLAQTVDIVTHLRHITSSCAHLSQLLSADLSEPYGERRNLLRIHAELRQLEQFRGEALHMPARGSPAGEKQILEKLFEPLQVLMARFEDALWDVVAEVVEWIRKGRSGVVVRVWKIVEVEGKEDEKAVAIRLVRKVAATSDAATRHRSMQASARTIKNYRHKVMDILTRSIAIKFEDHRARTQGDDVAYLDDLGWIYQDLMVVQDELARLVPADYNIFEFWTRAVHRNVDVGLKALATSEPEARVLLRMHGWIKEYRTSMKQLGVPQEWMQPPLLDGKQQDLIEDYVLLIVEKIDKWTVNLMHSETQAFTMRQGQPEVDEQGLYGLSYAVIMFEMMNQQVDLAADSGQGAVLARVVGEGCKVMLGTQNHWAQLLDTEYNRFINPPPPNAEGESVVPVGLEDYVMALTNDMLKSADAAEHMLGRLEPLVSAKYSSAIATALNSAIDGYLDLAKKCVTVLVGLIFNDLKSVSKQLFMGAWYHQGLVESMVATMGDYMADYEARLNPSLRDLLVQDLAVEWLAVYLNALRRVAPRGLKIPLARERMGRDISCVTEFFNQLKPPSTAVPSPLPQPTEDNNDDDDGAPANSASQSVAQSSPGTDDLSILTLIHSILAASPQMIFMDYWAFATTYGPQLGFIEALLRGRDDLDKQTVTEVMEGLRRKVREEGVEEPAEPTIMVKVKNPEEGLLANLKGKAAALGATTYSALRSSRAAVQSKYKQVGCPKCGGPSLPRRSSASGASRGTGDRGASADRPGAGADQNVNVTPWQPTSNEFGMSSSVHKNDCDEKEAAINVDSAGTEVELVTWFPLEPGNGGRNNLHYESQHVTRFVEPLTPATTPKECGVFSFNAEYKHSYTQLGGNDLTTVASGISVPAYSSFKNHPPCYLSYNAAKKHFLRTFPNYKATEATTGKIVAKEFAALLGGQDTYADYGGGGQPMLSVLRDTNRFLQTHIMGNPHSSNVSSSRSARLETLARTSAMHFLGADPQRYTLIWTANASAALGLVRQHYFADVKRRGVHTTVVMTDDMHNSMNGIRTVVAQDAELARLVSIVVLPVDITTLRIDEALFRNATRKLDCNERGLVLLTAQSNLSGVKHPYASLLRHAKQNGWDTLLDAAALLPTTPINVASYPEIDAIPISWYKIVGQPYFGALLVTHSFYARLHKVHFAGGTVAFVGNQAVEAFTLLEGAERFHDGTIPYAAFPQLYIALERLNRPRLREDVALRVQCLTRWLTEALITLRWQNTNHPLVRVAGFPYLSSDWSQHGGAIGLVFYDSAGHRMQYEPMFERLQLFRIDLRHGCMCNTVANYANPGLANLNFPTPPFRWQYEQTNDTWQLVPLSTAPSEPTQADKGVVRISLGTPSTFEDVYRIYEFAQSLLSHPLGKVGYVVPRKQVPFSTLHELKRWYTRWRTPRLLQEGTAV
ncbi:hypothetical protein QFC19_003547 [Naganishia cerealis]|uniref:Uncharacterized protein n=1 Tax=Naganishia cerealis TaxID=610337 RepID=A0ACC2W1E1_9TREE|nr:hypothetical protein QFC19_003547 [Naganishia cerealis]